MISVTSQFAANSRTELFEKLVANRHLIVLCAHSAEDGKTIGVAMDEGVTEHAKTCLGCQAIIWKMYEELGELIEAKIGPRETAVN